MFWSLICVSGPLVFCINQYITALQSNSTQSDKKKSGIWYRKNDFCYLSEAGNIKSRTSVFLCNSWCLWTDLSDQWWWDSWMFCISSFFCLPLETPWSRGNEMKIIIKKKTFFKTDPEGQGRSTINVHQDCCALLRISYPLAVLLLQVEIVGWVNAFLHASPVPRHPALDGHISGSRTQSKLL